MTAVRKTALTEKRAREERTMVNKKAKPFLPAIAKRLLPDGRISGRFWQGRYQAPDQSLQDFKVDLIDGTWTEYRGNGKGYDIQSLITKVTGKGPVEAQVCLRRMIGME